MSVTEKQCRAELKHSYSWQHNCSTFCLRVVSSICTCVFSHFCQPETWQRTSKKVLCYLCNHVFMQQAAHRSERVLHFSDFSPRDEGGAEKFLGFLCVLMSRIWHTGCSQLRSFLTAWSLIWIKVKAPIFLSIPDRSCQVKSVWELAGDRHWVLCRLQNRDSLRG